MSDNTKNPGDPDFEADFDDLDFDDVDLEEDDAVYDDITDEDLENDFGTDASDEPFEDEEWEEEEEQPQSKKGKKEKSLYTDTKERKSLNLSFNAMVIIGAVLLGGSVLAFTVMNKTAEVNAAKPSVFRSMLNIGNVLDGDIFAGNKESASPEEQTAQDPNAPTPVTEQGFLDNPEALPQETPAVENPPMPSPIAPSETENADVLTPMPDQTPRGPDEVAAEPLSAQAIIEQAIANRENRGKPQEAEVIAAPEPMVEEAAPIAAIPDLTAQPAVLLEAQPAKLSADDEAKMQEAAKRAADAEAQVQTLQAQIESLQSQMKNLQGELSTARDSRSRESQDVEKTIADLKQQLQATKEATAAEIAKVKKEAEEQAAAQVALAKKEAEAAEAAASAAKKEAAKAAATQKEQVASTPAPEKNPPVKKAEAPRKATSAAKPATTVSSRWELRAAQPGRAWVSKPGARDMQGVTVGETLPGIGRITAISYINGRWTVQGTTGQILQ